MKKLSACVLTSLFFLVSTSHVWANDIIDIEKPPIINITDFGQLIGALVGIFLIIAVIAALFYLLWGGFSWITSGGDKGKVEEAQNKIQAALIGLLIIFAIWALFNVIGNFLGINIFKLEIPKPF